MSTKKYIAKADRQLSDTTIYKKLQNDPTLQHKKLINETINRFKKKNCNQVTLPITNHRTPVFCMSPKVHKSNNPGRFVLLLVQLMVYIEHLTIC